MISFGDLIPNNTELLYLLKYRNDMFITRGPWATSLT